MSKAVKRPYVSAQREAGARATRAAILEAALRLFAANGYVATTIQAVADEAGVAVQTVYAVFGNKRELLRNALDAAVTGDAAPEPINERSEALAIAEEPDPRRRAELDAALSTKVSRRIAPITKVIREAAAADPEFAATAKAITAQRRRDMRAAAEILLASDGLPDDPESVVGTLYVLYSPDTFLALTGDLGWSVKRYERWLADMLHRAVLVEPS
jgi:TetR/AcrR family transcriptional regulator, regulator of autoinduction and epiphytic fitness